MSAQTSQAVSGAAQGAAYGSVLGPWGIAGGAVIGGVAGLISGGSADAQQENQEAWASYNNQLRYNTALYNISSSLTIADLNAAAIIGAANLNASAAEEAAAYNAAMIFGTTQYNAELLNQELADVWQAEDLDLQQLELFRLRERGGIVADQAASGTVIGEGSNADVVIDQTTQRLMDANIIMFNADQRAADIGNAIARGRWEGEVAINQTQWEGRKQAMLTKSNATIQASSSLVTSRIKAGADRYSAKTAFTSGEYGVEMAAEQFDAQQTQDMIGGLFKAAGTYGSFKIANKVPGGSGSGTISTSAGTSGTGGTLMPPPYLTAPGQPGSLSNAGSSLVAS